MAYVCNLDFFPDGCYTTSATGPENADGTITVTALGANGTLIRFALVYSSTGGGAGGSGDFTYPTGGVSGGAVPDTGTYTFTNLVPGTYTIAARNSTSCLKTIQVTVGYVKTYGPKYRLQYYDNVTGSNVRCRVDIEQLSYVGSVSNVNGGSNPARPSWRGESEEDVFTPVIGSQLDLTLLSETDEQFIEFVDADEREYRASYYIYESAAWVLKWRGYHIAQNQFEPYWNRQNYEVNIQFTDGLADLTDVDFTDDSGNIPQVRISVLTGILYCLHKTDIELQVWETVNILETDMNDGTEDSMLSQCYFDPLVYVNAEGESESCLSVLQSLMITFGCRIHQSKGHWQIDLITKKSATSVLTRKFAFTGGSISDDLEEYQCLIRRGSAVVPKVSFMERTGVKKGILQYGRLSVVTDLGIKEENNILHNGEFVAIDAANGQFDGWQYDGGLLADLGDDTTAEVVTISRDRENRDVLKVSFRQTGAGTYTLGGRLSSLPIALSATGSSYQLRFSMDLFAASYNPDAYIYFDIKFTIDTGTDVYHLSSRFSGDNMNVDSSEDVFLIEQIDGDPGYMRRYIKANTWETVTFNINTANGDLDLAGDFTIDIQLFTNGPWDVDEYAGLRAVDTDISVDYSITTHANRRRMHNTAGGVDYVGQYILTQGTDAESTPEIIRPTDYASQAPYHYVWKLDSVLGPDNQGTEPHVTPWMQYIYIDKVNVQYLPDGEAPETEVTSEVIINADNKRKLEINLRHFDLSQVDQNYKHITRGWLSLEDGTPTSSWQFRGASHGPGSGAPKRLLDLVQSMYRGHYTYSRRKLMGDMDAKDVFPDLGNTFYEVRSGRTFIPMALTQNPREKSLTGVELIEILSGGEIIDETTAPGASTPPGDIEPPEPPTGDEPNPFGVFADAFANAFA